MKKEILSLIILLLPAAGYAQTVSLDNAKQKAISFINRNVSLSKGKTLTSSDVTLAYQQTCNDETYYYVFNRDGNNGYVIVGGDENAKEILGYSDSGSFDYASAPPDMKWWLSQYESQISKAIAQAKTTSLTSQTTSNTSWASVSPLMTTSWGQDTPYNLAITESKSDIVAGCVAIAGAQVMKKWNYPVAGNDQAFDAETVESTYTAVATNTGITYQWDKMKDSYTYLDDDYTNENSKAVADLVYRVGRASYMNYSTSGSGTNIIALGAGMIKCFNYDKAISVEDRTRYTDDEWEALVYKELADGRPVIYSASSTNEGGHCFVCDGYDNSTSTFHINWGWRGAYDTYFVLTGTRALLPYTYTDDENYGFTGSQEILCGVKPDAGGELKEAVYYASPSLSVTEGDINSYVGLSVTATNLTLSEDTSIPLGVVLTNTSTGEEIYVEAAISKKIGNGISQYYMLTVPFYIPTNVQLGASYSVALAYKDKNNAWQKALTALSTTNPTLTINNPTNDLYVVSAPVYGDNGEYVTTNDFKVTFHIKNQSSKDVTTNLTFYIYPSSGGSSNGYYLLSSKTFKAGAVTDVTINASDLRYNTMASGKRYTMQLKDATNSYEVCKAFIYNFTVCDNISIDYTLSSAKWGTICLPFSADIPSGMKAYSVTSTSGSELNIQEETSGKFAMNTPYLINGTAGSYSFSGPDTPRDIYTNGMLTGITKESTTDSPVYAPANSYILALVDGTLGFYKSPSEIACRQYSAYLKLTGSTLSLPFFTFDSGTSTDISTIAAEKGIGRAYNILGQQVMPDSKGLVIINGKKYYNR